MMTDVADGTLAVVPSTDPATRPSISVGTSVSTTTTAVGFGVHASGDVPAGLGLPRDRLLASGFEAGVGTTLIVPTLDGPTLVAVGLGEKSALDAAGLRNAAAAFARAAGAHAELAF